MDKLIQLKFATVLLSSGLALGAFANTSNNEATTSESAVKPAQTQTAPANNLQSNSMQNDKVQLSDEALLSSVQSALGAYKDKVNVTLTNGIVYLSGQLDSDTDYEKVVTLAESTQGIGDVNVDKLTVKGSEEPLDDTLLTAKIKATLIQADVMGKDLPSWSVGVETKNGQVFLSGKVASAQEKQAILKVVKSVEGVHQVNDKIEITAADPATETNAATDTNAGNK
ncbi:BON domain-containing protein [Legionella hackeliae]|uniref:BON domain-containing protein n=1 Tax=Legionella hackeliae TaxID=449 RepID=A0A0A8UZ87_LEGHA|nr:BON domain-containing protein [Legionella hackeliae]KTD12648.1 osmotically inducible protein Y [Legionella hackeliae]CEK12064.1 exported protein of unknown function [Legionella hackeliae]STX48852.1 osmotically inducible protein Y [Legionella hackeliae]